jgi:hypothetical protein
MTFDEILTLTRRPSIRVSRVDQIPADPSRVARLRVAGRRSPDHFPVSEVSRILLFSFLQEIGAPAFERANRYEVRQIVRLSSHRSRGAVTSDMLGRRSDLRKAAAVLARTRSLASPVSEPMLSRNKTGQRNQAKPNRWPARRNVGALGNQRRESRRFRSARREGWSRKWRSLPERLAIR